jgi:hypothetical protein
VNSKSAEGLILAMQSFICIDEDAELRIWKYVIHNVWKGIKNDKDTGTVFSSYENIFFRELLRKKGVMTREYTLRTVCATPDMNDRIVQRLASRGVLDTFKLKNFNVIYTLNLNFYREVMLS